MTNTSLCLKSKGTLSWSCTKCNLLIEEIKYSYRVSSYWWQKQRHCLQHRAVHVEVQLWTGIENIWRSSAVLIQWNEFVPPVQIVPFSELWLLKPKCKTAPLEEKNLEKSWKILSEKLCNWEVGNTLWQVCRVRGAIMGFFSLIIFIYINVFCTANDKAFRALPSCYLVARSL